MAQKGEAASWGKGQGPGRARPGPRGRRPFSPKNVQHGTPGPKEGGVRSRQAGGVGGDFWNPPRGAFSDPLFPEILCFGEKNIKPPIFFPFLGAFIYAFKNWYVYKEYYIWRNHISKTPVLNFDVDFLPYVCPFFKKILEIKKSVCIYKSIFKKI